MTKRKPATASKHAHSPKIAAKAQRATQAVIRSTKDNRQRSVGVRSNQSPPNDAQPNLHDNARREAIPVENPVTALRDDPKQTMMTDSGSKKGIDFSSATANGLFKQSCWKSDKPTCNSPLNSLRGVRRLDRPLNFPVSSQNSQAGGSPCSGSTRQK